MLFGFAVGETPSPVRVVDRATTPSGLELCGRWPRVARSSQPRALTRNPVGIHHRRAAFTPLHLTPACTRKKLPTPSPVRTLKRAKACTPFQTSPVRGDIFVEPHPKNIFQLRQERHIHPSTRRCRSCGACAFYEMEFYKYAAPTALLALRNRRRFERGASHNLPPLRRGGEAVQSLKPRQGRHLCRTAPKNIFKLRQERHIPSAHQTMSLLRSLCLLRNGNLQICRAYGASLLWLPAVNGQP